MKTQKPILVDKIQTSLVDTSTANSVFDIALLKETKEIAEVLKIAHGKTVNLKELYNEMWLYNQET